MKWSSRLPIVLLLLAGIVWANPRLGWAQTVRYSRMGIAAPFQDPKSKTCKDAKVLKGRVISGTAQISDPLPGDSALATAGFSTVGEVFDAWYLKNLIPSMTHGDKLGQLAETRAELLDDLSRLPPGPARTALTTNLLKYAWGFASSNASSKFKPHPALRVNAMLLLGEINQLEESRSGNKRAPMPHATARRLMLKAWADAKLPPSMRVAILVGLGRHVVLDRVQPANSKMSAEDRNTITSTMLTLLGTDAPQGNLSAEGLVWMRRQAMEALADLQLQGALQEQFTQALAGVLADKKNSLRFRCAAAATLGRVTLPESHKPTDTAQALAQLAVDATAADLAELDRMIDELELGGGRGLDGYRGYDGGEGYGDEMYGGEDAMMGDEMYGGREDFGYGGRGEEGMYGDEMFGGDEAYGARRPRRRPTRTKPVIRIADERTVPTRRQLLHHLICVRSGLLGDGKGHGGVVSATGTDLGYVDSIKTELGELITAAKDVTTDLEDFRLALNTGNEKLVALLDSGAQAAPAEAQPRESVAPEDAFDDLPDFDGFE